MSEHKISFNDDQEKIVQMALDIRNQYLSNAALPLLDMDQFLQETVEGTFHCSLADIAANARNDVMQVLLTTMVKVPTEKIPLVISAADAASAIVAPKQPNG